MLCDKTRSGRLRFCCQMKLDEDPPIDVTVRTLHGLLKGQRILYDENPPTASLFEGSTEEK